MIYIVRIFDEDIEEYAFSDFDNAMDFAIRLAREKLESYRGFVGKRVDQWIADSEKELRENKYVDFNNFASWSCYIFSIHQVEVNSGKAAD